LIRIGSAEDARMRPSEDCLHFEEWPYEYRMISLGLTNAPAYFMAPMDKLFMESLNKFIVVFIDGILVYSKSKEEYKELLRMVL
jgi:hypothetical protein